MKRTFLTLTLLLCGLWAVAQTSPSQSSSPSSSQYPSTSQPSSSQPSTSQPSSSSGQDTSATSSHGSAEHQTKVKGCLNGSSGSYTLTSKSGSTYQLSGDTSKLAEHVGHTVEITGSEASPSSGSAASTSPGAGSSSTKTLDVSSVKHISETCSAGH